MREVIRALILLVLLPGLGLAQTDKDSWDNLKQLRAGQKIEVVDMDLKSLRGEFVSVTDGGISLHADGRETSVERESVLRVSAQQKGRRLRNVAIGAGIGAGAGLILGARCASASEPGWEGPCYAIGSLLVGGIGAGVGAAMPTGQKTLYRARQRTGAVLAQTLSGSSH